MTDSLSAISRTREILLLHSRSDEAAVLEELRKAGFTDAEAWDLLALVPMAFCYVMLEHGGVPLPQTCYVLTPDTSHKVEVDLDAIPLFVAAREAAADWFSTQPPADKVIAIAGRSATFRGINDLLNRGSKLQNIRLSRPVFNLKALPAIPRSTKPWWQFW